MASSIGFEGEQASDFVTPWLPVRSVTQVTQRLATQ